MKVVYLAPSPPPPVQGTDGMCNEIGSIQKSFGGDIFIISPFRSFPPLFPVMFYGMRHSLALKKSAQNAALIHAFFPYLVDFYLLRGKFPPIVYTITSGVEKGSLPRSTPPYALVVSSDQEADILESRGMHDVHVIRPGINLSLIKSMPPPEQDSEFVILAGSAPWTRDQFEGKGFDLLLELLHRIPQVRMVCLWRGILYREWDARIRRAGLAGRVEIINEKTEISRVFSQCHCAVVLALQPGLVKSFPNSLMEALAAGRPIIVSRAIPMSHYVEATGCGRVIETLTPEDLVSAVIELLDHYNVYRAAAVSAGRRDLSADRMVGEYRQLYRNLQP